jgi:hypothetical protein
VCTVARATMPMALLAIVLQVIVLDGAKAAPTSGVASVAGQTCVPATNVARQPSALTLAVWSFGDRRNPKAHNDLLDSYTEDFERELSSSNPQIRIVERRRFDRFRALVNIEKGVQGIQNSVPDAFEEARTAKVDAFVFGDTFDDEDGGEFQVSVEVQQLDTVVLAKDQVHIPRPRRDDPDTRREAMMRLAKQVAARLFPPQQAYKISIELRRPWLDNDEFGAMDRTRAILVNVGQEQLLRYRAGEPLSTKPTSLNPGNYCAEFALIRYPQQGEPTVESRCLWPITVTRSTTFEPAVRLLRQKHGSASLVSCQLRQATRPD